jgi:hypothetical protein
VFDSATSGIRHGAFCITATVLLLSAGSCRKSPADPTSLPVTSSFNQNGEGWTVVGDGTMFHNATGGNPSSSGYIFSIDRVEGIPFYFDAPGKFRGDLSAAYGRLLTFDLVWSETSPSQSLDADDVILRGGGQTITTQLPMRPGTSWTSYSIRLDEAGAWVLQGTDQPATSAQIQNVLKSLESLRIRGEFRWGPEQGGLDNVVLGA